MIAGSRLHLWLTVGLAWMWTLWFVQLPVTALPCRSLVPLISPWQVLHFLCFFFFLSIIDSFSIFNTLTISKWCQVLKKFISNKCYVCWYTLCNWNNKPRTFLQISLLSNKLLHLLSFSCMLFLLGLRIFSFLFWVTAGHIWSHQKV